MKNKWTTTEIQKLVKKVEAYKGNRLSYFKSIGMHPSRYYYLRNKITNQNKIHPVTEKFNKKGVIQLLSTGTASSSNGIELSLPNGLSLKINGNTAIQLFPEILNYLRTGQ